MTTITQLIQKTILWILLLLFILFYPMFISIYVFLPLFVGVMGYVLLMGIDGGKWHYIVVSLLYLLNLDINLSLPFFLVSVAVLLVYIFLYPYFTHFRRCKVCTPILTILAIDLVYAGLLLSYDFVFQTENLILDNILLYTLVIDLIVAVML